MDWLYVRYGQITPVYLMKKQDKMYATDHVEDSI